MTRPPYDRPQPVLEGARVRLRPARPEDAEQVLRAVDGEYLRWTTVPEPYLPEHARTFVEEVSPAPWAQRAGAGWVLCRPGDDAFCGALDLRVAPEDPGRAEVGYACAPWARGEGLVPAALVLAARWAFPALGLARLEWRAYVGNDASRRAAEKAGFRVEGLQRARLVQRGVRRDAWVGSLLPGDLPPA
ncbi:GNAT family N-acetyltransferase [Vallicoccus soli]|uniref:GNAT family N-acetyltransferase n=1 Tax=Vallicoccus soli TaxID=2339232 RepID=UPI0014030467|nr:GNAT family N-acetyltransferase [Vallicoccus soli]